MIAVAPGQVIDPAHPALMFISQNIGRAVAAQSLSFVIFDPDGVQVFPGSGEHVVNLTTDIVTDSNASPLDPLAPAAGYYAARWTVPNDAKDGKWSIRWTYVLTDPVGDTFTSSSSENPPNGQCTKFFEVVKDALPPGRRYAFVCDLREDLGCDADAVSSARLLRLSTLASAMIDRITGRTFEPAFGVKRKNGTSTRKLYLGDVPISLSSVGLDTEPTQSGDLSIDLSFLRVFNRHLQGVSDPDDRENPQLEFVHSDDLYGVRFVPFRGISLRSLAFPIGVQNVHVRGFFGFTDPDGSPWGDTPAMIQHACKLIVARELPKLSDSDARFDAQQRWRVTMEKTRDIQIQATDPRKWGQWFGDPEIDSLLASYVRPPALGAA